MSYVYKLFNKTVEKYYIGSRTKYNHKPFSEDLWVEYFSSSSIVKLLIQEYGQDSFEYECLREFDSVDECISYEDCLLKSIPKEDRIKYLNMNFSAGGAVIKNQTHIMITNGNTYLYFPKDIQIPDGWIVKWKFSPPSQRGKIKVIDPLSRRITMVDPSNIPDGYVPYKGYNKKEKLPAKTLWITDGDKNRKVRDVADIPDGWRLGKTMRNRGNYKGRNTRPGLPGTTLGKKSITNGTNNRFIDPSENIPDGWRLGSTQVKVKQRPKGLKYKKRKE